MSNRDQHPTDPRPEPAAAGIPTYVFDREPDAPPSERRCLEVALYWQGQLMAVKHFTPPRKVTIGDRRDNDFPIATDLLPGTFDLLVAGPRGINLCWTDQMSVEICGDDGDTWVPETRRVRLGLEERAAVRVGELTFVTQFVSVVRLGRASLRRAIDFYYTKILSLSFIAHVCLLLALMLTPFAPETAGDPLDDLHPLVFRLLRPPAEPPEAEPPELRRLPGPRAAGEAGRVGTKDARERDTAPGPQGGKLVDSRKRERDVSIAHNAGLLHVLAKHGVSGSRVFGSALGDEIDEASSGLKGIRLGDQQGVHGMASRGHGPGGGGQTIGLPGLSIGGPGGLGRGPHDPRLGERERTAPDDVHLPEKSCVSREQVRRVLDRLRNRARYCYERELPRNPNLEGKITTRFEIDGDGGVKRAMILASTLEDPRVEGCVLSVLRRQLFPACEGGGVALVTYPWIFKRTGR